MGQLLKPMKIWGYIKVVIDFFFGSQYLFSASTTVDAFAFRFLGGAMISFGCGIIFSLIVNDWPKTKMLAWTNLVFAGFLIVLNFINLIGAITGTTTAGILNIVMLIILVGSYIYLYSLQEKAEKTK